jgi:hypothetical protein
MPQVVGARLQDVLRNILRSAAHYHFHLNLDGPKNGIIQDRKRIPIEFFPLKEGYDGEGDVVQAPGTHNMYQNGEIEYEVDEGTRYGMTITNRTDQDLYLCCLFFDHADFSISELSLSGRFQTWFGTLTSLTYSCAY